MPIEIKNQAVIVIHGIGEQKPMDTLRGFVEAVIPEPESGTKYWSKPDQMSESFELRRLQTKTPPRTHFYEYYWAYKVEGTKISHVIDWVRALLFRSPRNVPEHLKFLWWLLWAGIAVVLIGIITAVLLGVFSEISNSLKAIPWIVSAAVTAILGFLGNSIKDSLGDAARYLSPSPKNIALRQAIRTDGIKLLRNIHESGKFDRVIVVGHSLGSVIAYDIIKHVWYEFNREYKNPHNHKQPALTKLEETGTGLDYDSDPAKLEEYRKAQTGLWKELRELGNPWLVTDFITLGCPLAHGFLLLAKDNEEFKERRSQRELPSCPPQADEPQKDGKETRYGYSFIDLWNKHKTKTGEVTLRALHSSAPFACTRWTNIYFPAVLGMFGDIVGGPVRKWFGPGIKDIKVKWSGLAQYTLIAHSSYWKANAKIDKEQAPLPTLVQTLDLEGNQTFK